MKQVKLTQSYIKILKKLINPDQAKLFIYFDTPPTTIGGESFCFKQISENPLQAKIIDIKGKIRIENYSDLITCDEGEILELDDRIAKKLMTQGMMEEI